MQNVPRFFLFAVAALPMCAAAHETFLPLHEDHPETEHGHAHLTLEPPTAHGGAGKETRMESAAASGEHRFAFASGLRYTRLSAEGERADLWEAAAGFDFAALPWLHLGGEAAYGWFDSPAGSADGWMAPAAHADVHLPLGGAWELTAGLGVTFPGGEEALVGRHWEWEPHLELRYDRGGWFMEADAGLAIVTGESSEHHHAEGDGHDESADAHRHAEDFHELADPHAERELEYSAAAGVRLLDERLVLEARAMGIHVLRGETADRNYLRAGARAALRVGEGITLSVGGSAPLTEARRNEWQAFFGASVAF